MRSVKTPQLLLTPRDVNVRHIASAWCYTHRASWAPYIHYMTSYHRPSEVTCAENVALLYLLHSVPVAPSHNEITESSMRKGRYSLSLTRERHLASTLAFLLNAGNDPDHVTALCIEENSDLASLNVVLAVNRSSWGDGNKVLQSLKQSFEKIFTILSEVPETRDNSRDIEHYVFIEIVSMCSHRILGRLRFVANTRGIFKQPLREVLRDTINSLKDIDPRKLPHASIHLFKDRAKEAVRLADLWAKHQKLAELENLVEGIYHLKQIRDLQVLLDSIPNRAMYPSSRQNLLNIIRKVSRYRVIARYLSRTARKVPSLRRANVVLVNLPKEAFDRILIENHTPQLASTISRLSTTSQRPDIGYLCRLLGTSDPQLNDQFAVQTNKTLQQAKIHAEIQLIYYYELNASRLPPRVICSSKDACFLCNTFILTHGKIHTPRYHGRLYPGWRLPSIPHLDGWTLRLNSALEDQIKASLTTMLSRKKRTVYPDPNESTLLTLPSSTSTLRTTALVQATDWREASIGNTSAHNTDWPSESLILPEVQASVVSSEDLETISSALTSTGTTTGEEDRVHEVDLANRHMAPGPSRCKSQDPNYCQKIVSESTRHETIRVDVVELIQGVPQVSIIDLARDPQLHITGALDIHIECAADMTPSTSNNNSELVYNVEWLSVEKSKELLDSKSAAIVDVKSLQTQTWHKLEYDRDMILMARGDCVRITPK